MPRRVRVLILGAGPVGLEAALQAVHLGYEASVLETGRVGEGVRSWGHVRMFSPWQMNCSPLGLETLAREGLRPYRDAGTAPTGREYVDRYLVPLRDSLPLRGLVREGIRVVAAGRRATIKQDLPGDPARALRPFRVLAQTGGRAEIHEADVLIDATGALGRPRPLGDGGIPAPGEASAAPLVDRGIPDLLSSRVAARFAGRSILLVGSGHSAATTAIALAQLAGRHRRTRVMWAWRDAERRPLYRRVVDDPLPRRDSLCSEANRLAAGSHRKIEPAPGWVVESIAAGKRRGAKRLEVTLRSGGRLRREIVDRIVANVGSSPESSIHAELQVHLCYASEGSMKLAAALLGQGGTDCLAQPAASAGLLSHPEPGFYILGSKSYGRNSTFLIRAGQEQVRELFAALGTAARLERGAADARRAGRSFTGSSARAKHRIAPAAEPRV